MKHLHILQRAASLQPGWCSFLQGFVLGTKVKLEMIKTDWVDKKAAKANTFCLLFYQYTLLLKIFYFTVAMDYDTLQSVTSLSGTSRAVLVLGAAVWSLQLPSNLSIT